MLHLSVLTDEASLLRLHITIGPNQYNGAPGARSVTQPPDLQTSTDTTPLSPWELFARTSLDVDSAGPVGELAPRDRYEPECQIVDGKR